MSRMDEGYRKMIVALGPGQYGKADKVEPGQWQHGGIADPSLDAVAYPPTPGPASPYHAIAKGVADTVAIKNEKYGDSYHQSGGFLRLLYPDGVRPDQYGDMLATVRVFDKLKRIATDRDALGESPFHDIAGYCLLALSRDEQSNHQKEEC
jgi:hypothetical protein